MAAVKMNNLTPASAWRKDYVEGVAFTMPHNGRTIALRALDEQMLLVTGKMPDGFSELALASLGVGGEESIAKLQSMSILEFAKVRESFNRAKIIAALAYPHVVDHAEADDEIEYEWLSPADKEFILARLAEPAEEWERFPYESDSGLESVSVGEVVEAEA